MTGHGNESGTDFDVYVDGEEAEMLHLTPGDTFEMEVWPDTGRDYADVRIEVPEDEGDESGTDRALKRVSREKRDVELEFPRTGDPNSTDDAYLHGKWRGLKFALQVLQEESE